MMELGALLCRPARPACADCPVAAHCAWLRAGRPAGTSVRPRQRYQGSDRQCRGGILAELRAASGPVATSDLGRNWPDQRQRARVLRALAADGLVVAHLEGMSGLPGEAPQRPRALPAAPPQRGRGRPAEQRHPAHR
jgi:A/G-specific adenine glycosylase